LITYRQVRREEIKRMRRKKRGGRSEGLGREAGGERERSGRGVEGEREEREGAGGSGRER
jgi:hypothetical protein